jgi:hypothetical protein
MRLSLACAVLAALTPGSAASAQTAGPPATCYGFAFGRWHPALDLAAAGHAPARSDGPVTPAGRSWAADGDRAPADSAELMLLPAWWPAGVRVRSTRLPLAGDTVKANALALVANGFAAPPRAQALIWGKRCDETIQRAPTAAAVRVARPRSAGDTARASSPSPPARH